MRSFLFLLLCGSLLVPASTQAQKRVLSYPFEFEKAVLSRADFDAYFLGQPTDTTFALVLKDNKKVEYVWLNKKFKTLAKIQSSLNSTIFNQSVTEYAGGTVNNQTFYFVYSGKDHYVETVDFSTKTVSHRKLFEDTKEEKPLVSFTSGNVFYSMTSNDKKGELVVYKMGADGALVRKGIQIPIPPGTGRKADEISEYLKGIKVVLANEQPDLSNAVHNAKLFAYNDRLELVVNNAGAVTHVVKIALPDFSVSDKIIDYKEAIPAGEKQKWFVSSFERDSKLFSLLLNKKEIRVAVHELSTGSLLKTFTFTDDAGIEFLAQQPVMERRLGKKMDEKELDIKKLIREMTKGTEGLMVSTNKKGQFIITFGTYDLIPLSTGGSSGGWQGGFQRTAMPGTMMGSGYQWNPHMYYRPGSPSYARTDARYYNTSYCRMVVDPATFKVTRGRIPTPETDQIKDYMEAIGDKVKATNQFSIGNEQFFGYYDRDAKAYFIDQIRIIH